MTGKNWPLAEVALKVLDLQGAVRFYESFGMKAIVKGDAAAEMAAGETVRIHLNLLQNGRPRPPGTAGLFHFALLLPDKASLGAFWRFALGNDWKFVGAADHIVSESLYFEDRERNGIEVYADRPAETWQWTKGIIRMATLPLDLEELGELEGPEWNGFPAGTQLGHMHLTVGDLDRAQQFYENLGMKLTLDWGTFRFMSWDGYHHHVAINLLEGQDAAGVTPEITGLDSFSIRREKLGREMTDPNGIKLKQIGG